MKNSFTCYYQFYSLVNVACSHSMRFFMIRTFLRWIPFCSAEFHFIFTKFLWKYSTLHNTNILYILFNAIRLYMKSCSWQCMVHRTKKNHEKKCFHYIKTARVKGSSGLSLPRKKRTREPSKRWNRCSWCLTFFVFCGWKGWKSNAAYV